MREEKQLLLDEIKDKMDQSTAIVLTSYQKLTPNMASDLRMKIGSSGGVFEVVRKRILIKAAAAAGFTLEQKMLEGHIGVFFALSDPVSVAKVIYQYRKENEDVLKVLGGRFEGQVCTASDVEQIAKLPSKDEMRAAFLGTLEAPLSQTLAVVESLLTSVLFCMENKEQSNN